MIRLAVLNLIFIPFNVVVNSLAVKRLAGKALCQLFYDFGFILLFQIRLLPLQSPDMPVEPYKAEPSY